MDGWGVCLYPALRELYFASRANLQLLRIRGELHHWPTPLALAGMSELGLTLKVSDSTYSYPRGLRIIDVRQSLFLFRSLPLS